jgi:hypothetical protein
MNQAAVACNSKAIARESIYDEMFEVSLKR